MKMWILLGSVFGCFLYGGLFGHLKKEEGLFYKYARHAVCSEKKPIFEKKNDGSTDSAVALIHGVQEFNQIVIARSHQKPVVVKFFSPQSIDSMKVCPIYQEVAETFKNKVSFVALNILEETETFSQVMLCYQLKKVDLPLFLFYKNGQFYPPSLQGYLTKENLENFIRKTFES